MVKENTRKEGERVQRLRIVLPKKKTFSRKGAKYGDRSDVWDHFDKVADDNGNVEKVVCIYCLKEYGPKPGGNLVRHLSSCQDFNSLLLSTSSEEEASTLPCQQRIRDKQASSSNPGQRDGSNDGVVSDGEPGCDEPSSHGGLIQSQSKKPVRSEFGNGKLVPAAGSLGYWMACRHLSRMMASHGHGCDSSLVENINFKKFLDTIGFEVPKREDIDKMCDDYKKKATGNICHPDNGIASDPQSSWKSNEGASTVPSQKIRDEQPSSSNPSRRDGSNGGAVGDGEAGSVQAADSLRYRTAACRHLSRMVASRQCDSSLVEDINFLRFLNTIGFEFVVPKREDIDKMCNDYKKKATGNISSKQIRHSSRSKTAAGWVSLAVGTVRIMEAGEVLYTACNFIDGDEWKLHRLIIGARVAVPLAPDYTGASLLGLGLGQPKELASLDDKVLNDAVLRDISEHTSRPNTLVAGVFMPQGIKEDISHISIKDLMQQKEEAERPKNLICSTYVDDVLHSVAQCLVPEESSPFIQQMRTNMKTLERFTQNNCHQAALPYPGLDYPRSYDKQWYSLYCCLKILSGDNNDDSTLKVCSQIDQSIKEISKPSCPTSNLCLVELFNVRKVLQSELERAASSNNNHAAGAALTKARDTLDKAIEESYLVWSIALVLDPRHRIWGLRTIFKEAYGKDEAESRRFKVESKFRELCGRVAECPCYPRTKSITCSKEKFRTMYLQGDPVKYEGKDFDILEWWKNDMKGQDCKKC